MELFKFTKLEFHFFNSSLLNFNSISLIFLKELEFHLVAFFQVEFEFDKLKFLKIFLLKWNLNLLKVKFDT